MLAAAVACAGAASPSDAAAAGPSGTCEKPGAGWKRVASSPQALVYIRGFRFAPSRMDSCLRGTDRFFGPFDPVPEAPVRTRGKWLAFVLAAESEETNASFYGFQLFDMRTQRLRQYRLRGFAGEDIIRLSLGASGVFLYTQQVEGKQRLVLRGRTRTRRLGSGPRGTFTRLQVRGRRASWTKDGKRHSVSFKIKT